MKDFYRSLTETEAKTMLAPLAAAIMLASDDVRESIKTADGEPYEPWVVVQQYESYLEMLYRSFKTIHDV